MLPDAFVINNEKLTLLIIPLSPLGRQYLMWFRVEYMKTPSSSQAPLLIRIFSWRVHWCTSFLLAITMEFLLRRATDSKSLDQTTYLTKEFWSSPTIILCLRLKINTLF
ncbi:hypothetical protein TorRG33x02_160110, partial [Trema orientale]